MKKQIGYKQGYRIIIRDSFFEVTIGKRAVYYGHCRENSTIEDIINEIISPNQDRNGVRTNERLFR